MKFECNDKIEYNVVAQMSGICQHDGYYDNYSTNSIIKNTDSGLILFENSKVWLLNKK